VKRARVVNLAVFLRTSDSALLLCHEVTVAKSLLELSLAARRSHSIRHVGLSSAMWLRTPLAPLCLFLEDADSLIIEALLCGLGGAK